MVYLLLVSLKSVQIYIIYLNQLLYLYLRNLLTHTVNTLLQTLNNVRRIQNSGV